MNGIQVKDKRQTGFGNFLLGLIQIILNPAQGWLDADRDGCYFRQLLVKGLFPFLILVSLSALMGVVYRIMPLTEAIIKGVLDLSGYFVSVYICEYFLEWAMNKWVQPKKNNSNNRMTFVLYTIGAMAFITLLNNIFPVDLALLSFLPLYILYIIWWGKDYMGVPQERNTQYMAVTICTLFLPPYILSYCLSILL